MVAKSKIKAALVRLGQIDWFWRKPKRLHIFDWIVRFFRLEHK